MMTARRIVDCVMTMSEYTARNSSARACFPVSPAEFPEALMMSPSPRHPEG
jgi:hypothetical protein